MPSLSLKKWVAVRLPELNQIEHAHQRVGGIGRGRRYATQQINHAYVVLLSSQFQGYCRDLHSECVDHIAARISPTALQSVIREEFVQNRQLDRGNPNPGNIGIDFNRLGVTFWPDVKSLDARNAQRIKLLEELNTWRNAIAHQDFSPVRLSGGVIYRFPPFLAVKKVRMWRRACEGLAPDLDSVMSAYIGRIFGVKPW